MWYIILFGLVLAFVLVLSFLVVIVEDLDSVFTKD